MLPHGRMITQPATVAGGQPRTPLTTINDLPLEIFCEIILLATPQMQGEMRRYYDGLRLLRLVATSWSALIDNHPMFWTILHSLDREPVWRMALQKSKEADIDVAVSSFEREAETRLIKAIVGHMPRVRSLRTQDRHFEYLIANASAAPRLRSLFLYVGRKLGSDDFTAPPLHPAKWAPNLRDVDLVSSRFIWMEPLWNSLEHLRIDTSRPRPGLPMQDIFTILQASPGLRSLHICGIMPSEKTPLPVVKLEVLESLRFDGTMDGSLVEVLKSIIALPTARCAVRFDARDETQIESTLQSICRIGSGIVDGEAGRKLELTASSNGLNSLTMGGFEVLFYSRARDKLNTPKYLTQIFEGLSPSRRAAVTRVEIADTTDSAVLPIVHSFFHNVSHLGASVITEALEAALGRPNEGWLFPHLETLTLSHHNNNRRLMGVVKPRLEAAKAGEHVTQIKTLNLKFPRWVRVDKEELAELEALVPNVVVEG